MSTKDKTGREAILDPVSRMSEIIFGLIMALSFTGTISAATAGREEVRTLLLAALGCNLAWGLVDAVMYVLTTITERARTLTLIQRIRNSADKTSALAQLNDALPEQLGDMLGSEGLEQLRQRLSTAPEPAQKRLRCDDFIGALGVFLLVVLVTFPVVIPFLLVSDTLLAMRLSNAVALLLLFIAGHRLGSYARVSPWRYGCAMTAIGTALVVCTIALGG